MAEKKPPTAADLAKKLSGMNQRGMRIPADVIERMGYDTNFQGVANTIHTINDLLPADPKNFMTITPRSHPDVKRLITATHNASKEARFK